MEKVLTKYIIGFMNFLLVHFVIILLEKKKLMIIIIPVQYFFSICYRFLLSYVIFTGWHKIHNMYIHVSIIRQMITYSDHDDFSKWLSREFEEIKMITKELELPKILSDSIVSKTNLCQCAIIGPRAVKCQVALFILEILFNPSNRPFVFFGSTLLLLK